MDWLNGKSTVNQSIESLGLKPIGGWDQCDENRFEKNPTDGRVKLLVWGMVQYIAEPT